MAGRAKKQFGAPKPLPGQRGYGVNPESSVALAKEAEAMEARLQSLREQVRLDNMRRKEAGKVRGKDGSLWQSGSANRGTLYRYSKQSRDRSLKSTGHARFVPGELEARKKREHRALEGGRTSSKAQRHDRRHKDGSGANVDLNALMSLDAQVSRYRPSDGNEAAAATAIPVKTTKRKSKVPLPSPARGPVGHGHTAPTPSSENAPVNASSQSRMPSDGNPTEWSIQEVASWLNGIGMSQYQRTFEKNEISGTILLDLDPDDLDYMNIKILAHRKTLIKEIKKMKAPPMPTATKQKKHWSHVEPLAHRKVSGGTITVNGADAKDSRRHASNAPGAGLIAMVNAEQGSDMGSMWAPLPAAPESDASSQGTKHSGASWVFEGKMDEEAEHAAFRKAIEELRVGREGTKTKNAEPKLSEGKENVGVTVGIGVGTEGHAGSALTSKSKRSCYSCYKLHYEGDGISREIGGAKRFFCTGKCADVEVARHREKQERIQNMRSDKERIEREQEATRERLRKVS